MRHSADPHPEASRSWMKDPDACRKYVDAARGAAPQARAIGSWRPLAAKFPDLHQELVNADTRAGIVRRRVHSVSCPHEEEGRQLQGGLPCGQFAFEECLLCGGSDSGNDASDPKQPIPGHLFPTRWGSPPLCTVLPQMRDHTLEGRSQVDWRRSCCLKTPEPWRAARDPWRNRPGGPDSPRGELQRASM